MTRTSTLKRATATLLCAAALLAACESNNRWTGDTSIELQLPDDPDSLMTPAVAAEFASDTTRAMSATLAAYEVRSWEEALDAYEQQVNEITGALDQAQEGRPPAALAHSGRHRANLQKAIAAADMRGALTQEQETRFREITRRASERVKQYTGQDSAIHIE
ncbi:MAG: hypothetical protein EOO16_09840 [Chitinophagaceae bacterium]|nr:MAG: hypothetical protein EOO16_09840 [Chitinophagaceae bacterium]